MRRTRVVLAGVAVLAMVLPASAQAGSLTRESDTRVSLYCDELTAGSSRLFLYTETSDAFGSYTELAMWSGGASGDPDVVGGTTAIVLTPTNGTGSVALIEPDDDPAGSATLSAAFAPSGPAEAYEFSDREGNQAFTREGVVQPLSVTGTLSVDVARGRDATFALGACSASVDTYTITSTNPSTYVSGEQQLDLSCFWQLDDGFVELFAHSDRFGSFSDLFVADGRNGYSAFTEVTFSPSSYVGDFDLFESESDSPQPDGSASASASLSRTDERISIRDRSGNHKFNATGWVLAVNGSLSIDVDTLAVTLPMDESSCSASDVHVQDIFGKTTGPKLKNDAPSGAIALAIGSTVEVQTGGTAAAAEQACATDFGGSVQELPFAHTAWWTFTGTGGDVTVDTVGSDFDTILGVYVLDGGAFEQVGCVDDVFDPETGEGTVQSRITIASIAGQTYYVQAGGYGGSAGTLRLQVD